MSYQARQSAEFFCVGGTLSVASESYIVRQADRDILLALSRGDHALVLDSRQIGKSSLLARAAHELVALGFSVIKLDLQRFGSSVSSEQWYAALFHSCAEQMNDLLNAKTYWLENASLGAAERWVRYLERWARSGSKGLVVFIDEIDYVRSLSFDTDELFATIRSSRDAIGAGRGLTFCFCGASTPAGLVRNPANGQMIIGERIQLDDFAFEETRVYAPNLHSQAVSGERVLRKIYEWVKGHPFLTQIACAEWNRRMDRQSAAEVDRFFEDQLTLVGSQYRSDHLISITKALLNPSSVPGLQEQNATFSVLSALAKIMRKGQCAAEEIREDISEYLQLSGVVRETNCRLVPRNKFYCRAFDPKWIRRHMPEDLVVLERRATRRAYVRAGLAFTTVIAVVGGLAYRNHHLARDLSASLAQSKLDELRSQNEAYVGAMQSISADISDGNFMRAGVLVDQLRNSRFADWEWSFLNSQLSQQKQSWSFSEPVYDWLLNEAGDPRVLIFANRIEQRSLLGKVERSQSFPNATGVLLSSDEVAIQKEPSVSHVIRPDGNIETYPFWVLTVKNGRLLCSKDSLIWTQRPNGPRENATQLPAGTDSVGFGYLWSDGSKCIIRTRTSLLLVDFASGASRVLVENRGVLNDLAVTEERDEMILAGDDPVVQRLSLSTGKTLTRYEGNSGPVRRCCVSADGKWILTGGSDGVIRRFSRISGELLEAYMGHRDGIENLRITPDQQSFYSSSRDKSVKRWSITKTSYPLQVGQLGGGFARLKLSEGENTVVAGLENGEVKLVDTARSTWNSAGRFAAKDMLVACEASPERGFVAASRARKLIARHQDKDYSLELKSQAIPKFVSGSDGSGTVIVAFENGEVWTVELPSGKQVRRRQVGRVVTAFIRRAEQRLYGVGFQDGTVELWSEDSWTKKSTTLGPAGRVMTMTFSPDGSILAAASSKGDVSLFDSGTLALKRVLRGHQFRVWRVSFSQDGKLIATASFDNTAKVWDAKTGREIQSILHKSWVSDTAFNPSGTRLITTCGDGSARLWDTSTWREVFVLTKQDHPLFGGRFSADGNSIVVADDQGQVWFWKNRS